MSTFTITTTTNKLDLDRSRTGTVVFTVTNSSGQNLRGRGRVKTDDGASPDWFTIAEPVVRPIPVDGTEQYTVSAKVPPAATPGDHRFRLDMVAEENPDELATEGTWIPFTVAKPDGGGHFPWLWVIIAAAVVLLAGIGFALWWFFFRVPAPIALEVKADPTAFGSVQVNSSSPTRSIKVTNPGGKPVKVSEALGGTNPGDFKLGPENCSTSELPSKGTCEIQVAFAPGSQGDKAAEVDFTVGSGAKAPAAVTLSGTGQGVSQVCFDPNPADLSFSYFLNTPPTTSQPAKVTIRNCGSAPLVITSTTLAGDPSSLGHFQKLDDQCSGRSFNAGGTCTVTLQFTTFTDGSRYAVTLQVADNAAGSPHVLPVSGARTRRLLTFFPKKTP